MKKIDLCEKLAWCPEGTKLWSPLFGECEFLGLSRDIDGDDEMNENNFWVHSPEVGRVTFDRCGRFFSSSEECLIFPSRENRDWDSWECPKPKVERFDPKTLKPFDRVLVRDEDNHVWEPALFGWLDLSERYPVVPTLSAEAFKCAVPYNDDTEFLLGKDTEAPEYYRWWEDAR